MRQDFFKNSIISVIHRRKSPQYSRNTEKKGDLKASNSGFIEQYPSSFAGPCLSGSGRGRRTQRAKNHFQSRKISTASWESEPLSPGTSPTHSPAGGEPRLFPLRRKGSAGGSGGAKEILMIFLTAFLTAGFFGAVHAASPSPENVFESLPGEPITEPEKISEKVCFALRPPQISSVKDLEGHIKGLHPAGRFGFLQECGRYTDETKRFLQFWDFETQEALVQAEEIPCNPDEQSITSTLYGFSDKGSFAYWFEEGGRFLKIRNLTEGRERRFAAPADFLWNYIKQTVLLETKGGLRMRIYERAGEKEAAALMPEAELKLKPKGIAREDAAFAQKHNSRFREWNLTEGLKETYRAFIPHWMSRCSYREKDMSALFFVGESGAIYKKPLAQDADSSEELKLLARDADSSKELKPLAQTTAAYRVSDSVEGFSLHYDRDDKEGENCVFLRTYIGRKGVVTNAVSDPQEKGYLLRTPGQKDALFVPKEWTDTGEVQVMEWIHLKRPWWSVQKHIKNIIEFVRWPYFVRWTETTVFEEKRKRKGMGRGTFFSGRIPSQIRNEKGRWTDLTDPELIKFSQRRRFSFEIYENKDGRRFRIVSDPFFPARRKILADWDDSKKCDFLTVPDDIAIARNIFGSSVILDLQTNEVWRFFLQGECDNLSVIRAAKDPSGISVLIEKHQTEDSGSLHTVTRERLSVRCVEPLPDIYHTEALKALERLASADDVTDPSHLSLLAAVLKRPQNFPQQPHFLQKALYNVLLQSPALYVDLFRHYPHLTEQPAGEPFFPPPGGEAKLLAAAKAALDMTAGRRGKTFASRLSQWGFLRLLQPVLRELSPNKHNFYMENITLSLVQGARLNPLLKNVYRSKLFYLAGSHVQELFGEKRLPGSDITVVKHEKGFQTLILSSDPIKAPDAEVFSTEFGIHYATVEGLSRDVIGDSEEAGTVLADDIVEWASNGEFYRAAVRVQIKDKSLRDIIPADLKSPDYPSVWRDGKMSGAMMIGSSVRHLSHYLTEEYLLYLKDLGFSFSSFEAEDTKKYFLDRVANCDFDYFIKHGHGLGDERNIMRIDSFNYIIKATLPDSEGKIKEELFLIFPRPKLSSFFGDELLSQTDLGRAVFQRQAKNCGQFAFFNITCFSADTASYTLEAAGSPSFLIIPSVSGAVAFENYEGNAARALLHSYRSGRDFEGFRAALDQNSGYQNKEDNRYIFPDEPVYQKHVFEVIHIPLKTSVSVERLEDGEWKLRDPADLL